MREQSECFIKFSLKGLREKRAQPLNRRREKLRRKQSEYDNIVKIKLPRNLLKTEPAASQQSTLFAPRLEYPKFNKLVNQQQQSRIKLTSARAPLAADPSSEADRVVTTLCYGF